MPNLLPNTLDVNIVRLYKALYDQAPGYTYLTAFRELGSVQAVSAELNRPFNTLTNREWATLVATNMQLTGTNTTGVRGAAIEFLIIQQNAAPVGTTVQQHRAIMLPGLLLGFSDSYETQAGYEADARYFNRSIQTSFEYSRNPDNTTTNPDVLRLADEPNTAPTAGNDVATATEGGSLVTGNLRSNDSDAQGDTLTYAYAATQAPVAGLTLNANGGFTFDPTNPAYDRLKAGEQQQVVVNVAVADAETTSNSTLTITVTGTNDAPMAGAAVASVAEDPAAPLLISIANLVTDPDGDALNVVITQPLRGSVTYNATTRQFSYTPTTNFNGTDSFSYTVSDPTGAAASNVITISVTPTNDAPVARAISGSGLEDAAGITLMPVSTDVDVGDTATYEVVAGSLTAGSGSVSFNGTNFVYVPAANFNTPGAQTVSFNYVAIDAAGARSAPVAATISVAPVNDAPVAQSQTLNTNEDSAASGTLGATDVDAGDTRSFSMNAQAANGTVAITNAATGAFTYTPRANFNGTDSFEFRVTDGGGLSSTQTVIINVASVNDSPVPASLTVTGFEDQPLSGRVQAVDADGDTLTYSVSSQPLASQGTVSMNPDGNFTFTPASNFFTEGNEAVTFNYAVSDGTATVTTGVVTIRIAQVDDVLTTGIDAINGSIKNDRFLGNQATLNAGDSITGGDGSDSVIISLENLPGGGRNFASFSLNTVELFQVTNDGGANAAFDLSSSDGIQTLRSTNSTSDVAFNYANTVADSDTDGFDEINLQVLNLTEGVSVVLDVRNDQAAGADEVNLSLSDSDDDGLDANEISIVAEAVAIGTNFAATDEATASGVELVNINTDGSDGSVWVNDLNTPGTTTINIRTAVGLTIGDDDNGDGTFDNNNNEILNPLSSTVSVVNASTSTESVFLSTGDNNGGVLITGGSGADRFELGSGNDTVVSGVGNDSVFSAEGADSITAGDGNDFIRGGTGNNTIDGGAGNDNITTGEDNDSIIGGTGNDTINAGAGSNSVTGNEGSDQITVGGGSDTVSGGADGDLIDFSAGGADIINGDGGNDTLNGGADLASSYTEFFHVGAGLGFDQVDGGEGTDVLNLTGDSGDDNDLDSVRNVESIVFGGADWDIAVYDGSWFDTDTTLTSLNFTGITGRVVFDGNDDGVSTNDGPFSTAVPGDEGLLSRAITIFGSGGSDTIWTGIGNDSIEGNAGDDVISTTTGNDVVRPGRGTDNVDLGAGNDVVIYKGFDGNLGTGQLDVTDVNNGGDPAGTDVIQVEAEDYFIGGGEVSTAVLGAGTSNIDRLKVVDLDNDGIGHRVDVTLDAGYAQTVLIVDAEDLDSDEQLNLNASANAANENLTVIGGAGNDTIDMGDNLGIADDIDGNNGTDLLRAQTVVDADFTNVREVEGLDLTKVDNDTATIGALAQAAGIRTVWDDAGNDIINASGYTIGLTINLSGGMDVATGGTGNDTINDGGDTMDTISGGGGNDSIVSSGTSVDVIDGGTGNDTIDGLGGDESTTGGDGDDVLVGYGTQVGAGDTINGGAGTDALHLSDALGNVSADIALPNVSFVESIIAVDADNDGLGNLAHRTDIDFVAGSVATLTVINVSGRGFDGTANGTGTSPAAYGNGGDFLNVDLSAIGDKDYAFNVTGGLGNDIVTGSALPENLNFQAGGGDDWLNVDATDLGTTLTMNGGTGTDRINMISGAMTDDSFESVSNIEVLSAHNGGIVTGTSDGAGDVGITLDVVPLNVQLGAQADGALNETTLGYISIVGTGGADSLLLDAAFNDAVRVNLSAGASDTVNGTASSSQVIVIADVADITATDTLSGGTTATDALWLTADNGTADLAGMSRIETITIVESADSSATLNFYDGNFTGVGTLTVNASALNDTTLNNDGGAGEGSLMVNAAGIASGVFAITGGTGADAINTGGGADTINGGADNGDAVANDTVNSGAGNDSVTTASGADSINAGTGADMVNAGNGNNSVWGGDGNDTITTGSGNDSVEGGNDNDTMTLGGGNDTAFGGAGSDSVEAGDGNDQVRGDAGGDTINGGAGNDTIIGGAGPDSLTGGTGADRFVYELRSDSNGQLAVIDTITDYESGTDRIDFRLVGLDPAVLAQYNIAGKVINFGGNGIDFGDAQAGTHRGDDIVDVVFQADQKLLWVDLNDDGTLDNNDLRIRITNVNALSASDVNAGSIMGTIMVTNGSSNAADGNPGSIVNDHFTAGDGGGVTTIDAGAGMDTLIGGTGPDSLIGGSGNDSLNGNGGADTLLGGTGDDNLSGGDGADSLDGGEGNDVLTGGPGADTFVVNSGMDTIVGFEAGVDTIVVGPGATAVIEGTGGDDTIDLSGGVTNNGTIVVNGMGGGDTITGSGGVDQLNGGDGDDSLIGGGGADSLMGGIGNDTLVGKDNDAVINGGDGTDTLATDFNDVSDAQIVNVEAVRMDGPDLNLAQQTEAFTITGTTGNDTIVSGAGGDTIMSGDGADSVRGGAGVDSIDGGAGDDILFGDDGADSLIGGANYDQLHAQSGDALIDGGADSDDLIVGAFNVNTVFDDSSDGQIINIERVSVSNGALNGGSVNLFSQTEAFTVLGHDQADTLTAGQGGDSIEAGDGADWVDASGGNDTVYGGEDADNIMGGDGDDSLFGGGPDFSDQNNDNDTLNGGSGVDSLFGEDGDDLLIGDDNDALFNGGNGSDTLQTDGSFDDVDDNQIVNVERVTMASSGFLTVSAQIERLTIVGSGGADTIIGAEDNDTIMGGNGADSITGGPDAGDADSIDGGAGNDTIVADQDDALIGGGADTDTLQVGANFNDANDGQITSIEVVTATADALTIAFSDQGASENFTFNGFATGTTTITGGAGNDTFNGGTGADSFLGGGGTDSLIGGAGNDTLDGGAGDDMLVGGANNDTYNVTEGTDTITFADWNTGTNVLNVSVGATARLIDAVGNTASTVDVSTATNNGTIRIEANGGNDTVIGSAGNDSIIGGAGADSITTGAGSDTVVLDMTATGANYDTVTDFDVATDIIGVGQTGVLQKVVDAGSTTDLAVGAGNGHVVVVANATVTAGQLTNVTNNEIVENRISGAIENVKPVGSAFPSTGGTFTVILSDGTDSGVYKVTVTTVDQDLGTEDFSITLVGILQGVDQADLLTMVDGNVG